MNIFCKRGRLQAAGAVIGVVTMASGTMVHAADVLEEVSLQERMLLPAVSDVNGKVEAAYVHFDLDDTDGKGYLLQGAVSLPVGQHFGFQLDAGTLNADFDSGDVLADGIGGHLFWRDPSVGLLGFYGHHVRYGDDVTVDRLGAELEWYSGQLTFEGFAGTDHLDTSIGDEDFFAGEAVIAWYATDNFRLAAGVQHSFEQTKGLVGMELMLDGTDFAPAFYANAAAGEDETTLLAGVRVYLGKSKSLKARHREDDPAIGLFDQFGAVMNCGQGGGSGQIITDFSSSSTARSPARISPPPPSNPATYELDGCDVKQKGRTVN